MAHAFKVEHIRVPEYFLDSMRKSLWESQLVVYRDLRNSWNDLAKLYETNMLTCSLIDLNWLAKNIGASYITPHGEVHLR